MPINVSTTNQEIEVSTSGQTVQANVSGGQGPQGPAGPPGPQGPSGASNWSEIVGIPETFPPSAHSHIIADVTGLQDALDAKATPADVSAAVSALVNSAPSTLDTLNELAAALGNDASFATTVTNALASKAPLSALNNDQYFATTVYEEIATKAPLANPTFTGTVSGVTKSMVGLGNVDNTSDANKPISTATQTALDGKSAYLAPSDATPSAPGASHVAGARGLWDNPGEVFWIKANDGEVTIATTDHKDSLRAEIGAAAASHTHAWSAITSTPTTLAGYGITDAVVSSDARLTNARTPTAHKSSHATGGSDALTPSDIGAAAVSHTHSALTDITGLAASATTDTTNASNISSGTLAASLLPSSGVSGDSITTGTVAAARLATHTHSAADITSGTVATARLGSGTASASNYLRGDQSWAAPTASDVGAAAAAVVYEFTRTTKPAAASGSNGSYTFALPSGAKVVEFLLIGGGGGGGSGRRGAAGTNRFGGGGGGGGGAVLAVANPATLTSSLSIQVGGGGGGGASRTTDDTDGANGSAGGVSSVTHNSVVFASASPGSGGNGGSATAGAAGAGSSIDADVFRGGTGGASSVTATAGAAFSPAGFGGVGGGGGGGISSGNAAFSGGTQRTNQTAQRAFLLTVYGTQTGGASSTTAAAGAGASGLDYGHGGNGGGASANGFNSGAGGNGGDGYVRITVWF